jgi:hypothetical protein
VTYEAVDGGSGQVSATLDNATITSAITNVVEEEPAPEPTPTPTTPPAASPAEATRADPTFTG